jgi:DNA invertase Pin-like site-specific DNA recombinase
MFEVTVGALGLLDRGVPHLVFDLAEVGASLEHPGRVAVPRLGLDALLQAVRRRQVDVVVCTKLDRLTRSVRHLVTLGEEFRALGVELCVLDQAVDTTTSGGRALFGMLAVFAEFERDLIRSRADRSNKS